MKYICTNPEEIKKIIDEIGYYGPGSIINRFWFNKAEPEAALAYRIVEGARKYLEHETDVADVTDAFNYYVRNGFDISREWIWDNLKKAFIIKDFSYDENGEDIIHVEFIPNETKFSAKEEKKIEAMWNKLEKLFAERGLAIYNQEQITSIVKGTFDRYLDDLSKRGDMIFEVRPVGEHMYLEGMCYLPEKLEYKLDNGETVIFDAGIRFDPKRCLVLPECRTPDDRGDMTLGIYRRSPNGETHLMARIGKDVSNTYGITQSCRIERKEYQLSSAKNPFNRQRIVENYGDSISYEGRNATTEEIMEFSKQLIEVEKIDKLYDLLLKKAAFIPENEDRPNRKPIRRGLCTEIGDWPDVMKNQVLSLNELLGLEIEDEEEKPLEIELK